MNKMFPIEFIESEKEISIKFNISKFGTKHLDSFADLFYKFLKKRKLIIFDLSDLSWIAHEELVYLSAIFDQLYQNEYLFRIKLKNDNPSNRQIRSVIYLWENWQIFSFIKIEDILANINLYFDLSAIHSEETKTILKIFFNQTENTIDQFIANILYTVSNNETSKKDHQYFDIDIEYILDLKHKYYESVEIDLENNIHKITPFVKLLIPFGDLDEKVISENLDKIYKLDEQTITLLESHSSDTPFLNRTLSSIITKELYENAIEHAYKTKKVKNPACFLSVTLRNKIYEEGKWSEEDINSFNKANFDKESIAESVSFYKDGNIYKNQSLIQFTFIDFGSGIPTSLKEQAKKKINNPDDTDILAYAFNYTSSRFPLSQKYLDKNSIPRGLFDVISIVRRYNGLLIARSNFGKLIYDFTKSTEIENCVIKYDKSNSKFFNGTIITILIPENNYGIELKTIKPQYLIDASNKKPYYLSILDIEKAAIKKLKINGESELLKKQLYNETLDALSAFFEQKQNENCTIFLDFNGCHLESQVSRKILFFLASDYRINEKTNAIVFNPPNKDLVTEIQLEILSSPKEKQNLIFHPIPCMFQKDLETEIVWIGISEKSSYDNLNNVLHSLIHNESVSDYESRETITESGLFYYDDYGNIKTLVGVLDDQLIFNITEKARFSEVDSIYLCSGNYYQYEYLELLEQLYDVNDALRITNLLKKKIEFEAPNFYDDATHFLAITLSSQLIADSFISQLDTEIRGKTDFIRLSNYHSYHLEEDFIRRIDTGNCVIVICDVISTGYLITSLKEKLSLKGAKLLGVISVFDTRCNNNKGSIRMFYEEDVPTISLKNIPIDKYSRNEIENISKKKVIRINPVTNTQISLKVIKSELTETVLLNEKDFLSKIDFPKEYIKIGYFNHNNLFHPYFFETHKLFDSPNGTRILKDLITIISSRISLKIDFVFYPLFSGAEKIKNSQYKMEVFNNHSIEIIHLARFNTPFGWRFTFPPKFLNDKTINSDILILDDGSCTGSTIIQMIDEISFLDVSSITLLSVIGRTDDFIREFFSRIKSVKVKILTDDLSLLFSPQRIKSPDNQVPLNIFFGSQWHIPTYSLGSDFPFFNEQKQLNQLINIENLPTFLFNYVNKRLKKISLTDIKTPNNINYLPTEYTTNEIPIIELLYTRSQLGKIHGYRFYEDYFEVFNDFVNSYYLNEENDIYSKQIELYLSVLIHEPYIIQSIQDFLPDVYEVLIKYTEKVITNSDSSINPSFNKLHLNWNRASFISIYLNLRKNKVKDVLSPNSLDNLLLFISEDETINSTVIFTKYILNYIPLSKSELLKQEIGIFCLTELTNYINQEEVKIKQQVYTNIKLFKSFLNSLSYLDKDLVSKKACLNKLIQFYQDEKNYRNHDVSLERQLGILKAQSRSIPLSKDLFSNESKIEEIIKAWRIILPRLEQYQRYVSRLVDFFDVYKKGIISHALYRSDRNLFKVVREISEIIENNQIVEKWSIIYDYAENILLSNFFSEEAFMYDLFLNFNTINIVSNWNSLIENKIKMVQVITSKKSLEEIDKCKVDFPLKYLTDVVFPEIRTNFRYSDLNEPIIIEWSKKGNDVQIMIKNKIGINGKKGGNNGEETFNLLAKILNFEFYFQKQIDGYFIQKYKFKSK